jgi:hypothetical protein
MDMKFCKHVLNLLRYYKIIFDRYTYMRKNRDISPQTTTSLVLGGPKKQVQPSLNVSFLKYRRNWGLKFGEIVVIRGDYKILWLEFVKTLLICFNSPISARIPCCGSFGKKKQRTLGVNPQRIMRTKMVLWCFWAKIVT